ncbi:MAG: hypothetical protein JXB50_11190, partial [Spirochaetes bacterium]|nr:hypothetical protein [Spirochaetota bacterium]
MDRFFKYLFIIIFSIISFYIVSINVFIAVVYRQLTKLNEYDIDHIAIKNKVGKEITNYDINIIINILDIIKNASQRGPEYKNENKNDYEIELEITCFLKEGGIKKVKFLRDVEDNNSYVLVDLHLFNEVR